MLHFVIGTKAQFIKLVPLMHQLQEEQVNYHLLDLSQHGSITAGIIDYFDLTPTKSTFSNKPGQTISTYADAFRFILFSIIQITRGRKYLLDKYFHNDTQGCAIIHGDTLSTLVGLCVAKRAGLTIALVEAGLTSGNLFNPFPEETIGGITHPSSDYLFAPGRTAESNLLSKNVKGVVVDTEYNTGKDALQLTLKINKNTLNGDSNNYLLVTLHRLETISNRSKLSELIKYIISLSKSFHETRFFMHQPTENALKRANLYDLISTTNRTNIYPLLPYNKFIDQLTYCDAIITDGGSIQEEAYYLKKPCLVLRKFTERPEGIGENVKLMSGDLEEDTQFLKQEIAHDQNHDINEEMYATEIILNTFSETLYHPTSEKRR